MWAEADAPGQPGTDALRAAREAGWIRIVEAPGTRREPGDRDRPGDPPAAAPPALGLGEASLFEAARPDDRLVLDDPNARRFAEARGLAYVGLVGLLVRAVEEDVVPADRGLSVLSGLARSDVRMSVELYDWARERIERHKG